MTTTRTVRCTDPECCRHDLDGRDVDDSALDNPRDAYNVVPPGSAPEIWAWVVPDQCQAVRLSSNRGTPAAPMFRVRTSPKVG